MLKVAKPRLKPEPETSSAGIGNKIYTSLMNGVSHMLPLVVIE